MADFVRLNGNTLIVQTDDLIDDVLPDWTGFIDSVQMKSVYAQFKKYVDEFLSSVMSDQIEELQLDVIRDTRDQLETLEPYGKRDVSTFIEVVTAKNPIVNPDFLKSAVEAMISIEKARHGDQLLKQLSQMSPDDIDKLAALLNSWDIDDVLTVMNEIDKRIVVVEAIKRIYDDKTTDELHTLHPLVLNARWLFGYEYDSPMFTTNIALSTVIKKLFKDNEYDLDEIKNPRCRPDIVCLKKFSLKSVCTDRSDQSAGGIMKPDQILIIELKRGGFEITADEVTQAGHYVRQIRKSGVAHSAASINCFCCWCVYRGC